MEEDVTDVASLARAVQRREAEAERIAISYADRQPVTVLRPPRIVGPADSENRLVFERVSRNLRGRSILTGHPRPLSREELQELSAAEWGVKTRMIRLSPALRTALEIVADGVTRVSRERHAIEALDPDSRG